MIPMTTVDAPPFTISALATEDFQAAVPDLAEILHASVHDGASVGFILPFVRDDAEAWWRRKVAGGLASGGLALLAARSGARIVGTVQLDTDTPPNQPHRAEVRKLLVHPDHRRRGIARALMAAVEAEAVARRRWLLTLDTRTGDGAEPLYLSLGYAVAGRIPDYCRDTLTARFDPTTVMYKRLG